MALSFEYWSDPLCIWAYVAQTKLEQLLAAHGDELRCTHRIVPLFGSLPRRFATGSWASAGPAGRAEATARVASEHPRPGGPPITGRVWLDTTPTSSWSPSLAVKAVDLLERAGHVQTGQAAEYLWALRRRFFEDNVDITGRAEQLIVAERQGLDPAAVVAHLDDGSALASLYEDHEDRERLRLRGSPSYVFDGGRSILYGNFAYEVLAATVKAHLDGLEHGGSPC